MPHLTDIDQDLERLRLTRSGFMRATVVSVAALSAGGAASLSTRARAAPPPKGPITRYPLRIPDTVSPAGLTLTEAPTTLDLANTGTAGGAKPSKVWAYNGTFPGPSIVANSGDIASITLNNGLSEETITHWHGMIVDEDNDGGPFATIAPGGSKSYEFPINQRACLNFYHPHPHMLTGKQVNLGLAGAFIVRDTEEGRLGLPSEAYEVPLIIRDATLDSAGNIVYKPRSGGFDGQIPLVNGTLSPFLAVDKGVYRFRVLNGANARIFGLALSNNTPFTLIGNDGGLLASPATPAPTRIDIAPGERLDILLDFSSLAAGQSLMLKDQRSGWDLLEFRGTGNLGIAYTAPLSLSSITPLSGPTSPTRTFSFDGMSKINGKLFDHNRIDFEVPYGATERWRFVTNGNAPHPVHVHGASFQVIERKGGRNQKFAWEYGWKDVVLLEDRETVDVFVKFGAPVNLNPDGKTPNRYVIHCHKLEHEDMGMMSAFQVVPSP